MSAVYVSKNCLVVVLGMSIFFSFLLINQDVLGECKLFLSGCPRNGGRWRGKGGTSEKDRRPFCWQGEASACCPSYKAAANHFVTGSPFWQPGKTSCLRGCSRASAGPAGPLLQLCSMLVWSGNPTVWHWLVMLLLGFSHDAFCAPSWISAMKLTLWQGTSHVFCKLHLLKSKHG